MTDLSTRYGTRPRRSWLLPVAATAAIAIAIAWVIWVATADKPFQARVYGYEVVNAHVTTVRLDIHRPKPVGLECTVYAQAEDHSIVGERTIKIAPSVKTTIRTNTRIVTERLAVTGILKGCTVLR